MEAMGIRNTPCLQHPPQTAGFKDDSDLFADEVLVVGGVLAEVASAAGMSHPA